MPTKYLQATLCNSQSNNQTPRHTQTTRAHIAKHPHPPGHGQRMRPGGPAQLERLHARQRASSGAQAPPLRGPHRPPQQPARAQESPRAARARGTHEGAPRLPRPRQPPPAGRSLARPRPVPGAEASPRLPALAVVQPARMPEHGLERHGERVVQRVDVGQPVVPDEQVVGLHLRAGAARVLVYKPRTLP